MSVLPLYCLYFPNRWTQYIIKGTVEIEGLKRNIYSFVYITGPGVDWEVTHPMCCHLTNINPISLKDWTLCLHMGPEWDYPVLNSRSDICFQGWKKKKNFYFCCPVTLAFLLLFSLSVSSCRVHGLLLFRKLKTRIDNIMAIFYIPVNVHICGNMLCVNLSFNNAWCLQPAALSHAHWFLRKTQMFKNVSQMFICLFKMIPISWRLDDN